MADASGGREAPGLSRARAKLVRRLGRRKSREREGLVLVEGERAASEALACGARVAFAVSAGTAGEPLLDRLRGVADVHTVDEREFRELGATATPQGLLLVCEEPRRSFADFEARGDARCVLALDGVQDPGNVGTLIRAAAAFGAAGVVALDGTADPWGAKAVRASAGTVFRVPCALSAFAPFLAWVVESGRTMLVADSAGVDVGSLDAGGYVLVVGSEGGGARPQVVAAADGQVGIPMPGGTESLNAALAGGILLYALTREGRG